MNIERIPRIYIRIPECANNAVRYVSDDIDIENFLDLENLIFYNKINIFKLRDWLVFFFLIILCLKKDCVHFDYDIIIRDFLKGKIYSTIDLI